jgi:AraC family transcriptional regulator
LSEFHFHRVFAAVMQESVGEFITRHRLETAALRLAYHPWASVTQIALESGYSSTANFSKAFAAYFGCRPSDVRDPSRARTSRLGKLTSRYGKDFDPATLHALPALPAPEERERRRRALEAHLRFETRTHECPVVCLESQDGYSLAEVERTWATLIRHVHQLGLADEAVDAWGIPHDSPSLTAPELCRYHACVPIAEPTPVPAPLFTGALPCGRFAVFRFSGPVSDLESFYREVYGSWFPSSSLAPDDFRPLEHYVHDAPVDGRVDMEIWIKVRPRPA